MKRITCRLRRPIRPLSADQTADGGSQMLYLLARLSWWRCGDQILDVCFFTPRATRSRGCGVISMDPAPDDVRLE